MNPWRDPDDAAWTARARVVHGAVCDVLFDWVDDVYYGPADEYFVERDRLREMLPAIAGAENGPRRAASVEVYDDLDQGWHARFVRQGDRPFVLEWNWETPEDPAGRVELSLDLTETVMQARAALARLRAIQACLVDALGRDYWNFGVVA